MLNSAAAGRRQARQVVVAQAITAVVVALVCLAWGWPAALGAMIAGSGVALGSALMAWRTFRGTDATGAGTALFRLVIGLALKWMVIAGALFLALARLGLPPVPTLAGLSAALLASLLAYRIK